jgi:hypothetical protein
VDEVFGTHTSDLTSLAGSQDPDAPDPPVSWCTGDRRATSAKVESSRGTFARAGVTFTAIVFGRFRLLHWAGEISGNEVPRRRAQIGRYLTHDRLGAELLGRAG